jgi:hypothetical protein
VFGRYLILDLSKLLVLIILPGKMLIRLSRLVSLTDHRSYQMSSQQPRRRKSSKLRKILQPNLRKRQLRVEEIMLTLIFVLAFIVLAVFGVMFYEATSFEYGTKASVVPEFDKDLPDYDSMATLPTNVTGAF